MKVRCLMKNWLENIRKSDRTLKLSKKIVNSCLILTLGILLGIISKWLDNMSINDTIWYQHILGVLDLRNVFSEFGIWIFFAVSISVFSKTPVRASLNVFLFFLGMTISYHLYTIIFAGFNPITYMMIWYIVTLISPILAYTCWYAKGKGKIPFIINVGIISTMLLVCFAIGMWYFDFKNIIDTLIFLATLCILYQTPKKSIISITCSIILSFVIKVFI